MERPAAVIRVAVSTDERFLARLWHLGTVGGPPTVVLLYDPQQLASTDTGSRAIWQRIEAFAAQPITGVLAVAEPQPLSATQRRATQRQATQWQATERRDEPQEPATGQVDARQHVGAVCQS